MNFFLTTLCCLLFSAVVRSQECLVLADSLQGKYTGECKNGKAEGQGKAEGSDSYEGEFKAGLPHGVGKYSWRNGNSYTGKWQKGNREGKGIMVYKINNNQDSIVEGFWKKDKFLSLYERPYKLISNTVHITSIAAKKLTDKYNQLEIVVDSETGKQVTSYGGENAAPQLTDITIINGAYVRLVKNPNLGKKISYTLEDVTFPFRAIFTIGNDALEIEFFEAGKWSLDMRLAY